MVICRFAVMKWMTVTFFCRWLAQSHYWWIIENTKSKATRRQISFLLLFNCVKTFFSLSLFHVIKTFYLVFSHSKFSCRFLSPLAMTFNKSPRDTSAIELSVETSCHLSIDFRFNMNGRKVESTDKHECERWSIKNNCVLF